MYSQKTTEMYLQTPIDTYIHRNVCQTRRHPCHTEVVGGQSRGNPGSAVVTTLACHRRTENRSDRDHTDICDIRGCGLAFSLPRFPLSFSIITSSSRSTDSTVGESISEQ